MTSPLAQRTRLELSHRGLSGGIPSWFAAEAPRLEALDLSDNALSGEIPAELANLSKLQTLDLSRNRFSGPVPPLLGSLSQLAVLYLNDNSLTGEIPPQLASLSKLQQLDLSRNRLSGPLLPQLGNLEQLTQLYLPDNSLTGEIPPQLAHLSKLQVLDLSRNPLSGPVPPQLENLTQLTVLALVGNRLSGPVPPQLGNLTQLTILWLNDNSLTGEIPPQLANLSKLQRLSLHRNRLSGPVPPQLGSLTRLVILWLNDNSLTGEIPPQLANLGKLQSLSLHRNRLSGPVLPQLGSLAQLTNLNLYGNSLNGEIPPQLAGLSRLEVLDLSSNRLSGPVPPQLGNLTQLTQLYLLDNLLVGEIPPELAGLGKLQILMIHRNRLSGPVPPQLGSLAQLAVLNLNDNFLTGEIPPELAHLSKLRILTLSRNRLFGPVPPQLGNLTQLTKLYLYENFLTGEIPPQLARLSKLQRLSLYGNRLSGPVPPQLRELSELITLDLAFNALSGRIVPNFFAGLSRLQQLNLARNPGLNGDFPTTETAVALREIWAFGCGFTGALALGPAVQEADFRFNRLTALPATWHAHEHLKRLKLDGNEIADWPRRGVLPRVAFLGGPKGTVFDCSVPLLSPPFVWPQLQELDVSGNPLGPATDARDFLYSLSYLPQLKVLRARGCRLQGEPQGVQSAMHWVNVSDCKLHLAFTALQNLEFAGNLLQAVRVSPPSMLLQANFSFNVLGSSRGAPGAAALHSDWWRITASIAAVHGSVLQALDLRGNPDLRAEVLPPAAGNCVGQVTRLAADPANFKPIAAASNVECTKPCQLGLNLLVDAFTLNAPALCRCMAGTAGANLTCKPCPTGTHAQSQNRFRMHPTCRACPAGSTTLSNGSSSACDCKCDAGSYMTNATACAVGVCAAGGRMDPSSMRCRPCGALLTTSGPGAISHESCICDQMRIQNLVDLGARACGCAEGSYLDVVGAACRRCPPGRSAERGAALDGPGGCRVTATFFLLAFGSLLAAAGALFALPIALGLLPLHLRDMSLEEGRLVATTSIAHGLLRWRPVLVTFEGTGHPALDFDGEGNPAAFKVAARGAERLSVLTAGGEPETRALDASQGLIRMGTRQALLSAGIWHLPAAGIVLFLAPIFVALEVAKQRPPPHLLVDIAVSLVLAAVVHMLRLHRSWGTPLATRCSEFSRTLKDSNPSPQSTPKGAARGLTAGQLDHFYRFFEHFIGNRNMYYVCSNIVKPLTEPSQLSYVDLVGAQQLTWFVSHYWGMGVRHFVEAILKHARADGTPDWHTQAYWICTFSNNQWRVEEELGHGRWEESSFYLALRSSACRATLMVVDSQVEPLRRAWCLFEVLQTMELRRDRPDFAGLLLGTSSGVLNFGHSGMDIAMALASELAAIDVRTAQASNEEDLAMILRLVEGRPGGFDAVNSFLRQEVHDALTATQQRVQADFQALIQTLRASLPGNVPAARAPTPTAAPQGGDPSEAPDEDSASPMAKPSDGRRSAFAEGVVCPRLLAAVAAGKWQTRCRWLRIWARLLLLAAVAAFGMDLTVELA